MFPAPEAFQLLSLSNTSLTSAGLNERGILSLECVTIPQLDSQTIGRDVYLVLRLNISEIPIDPARSIRRDDSPGCRKYIFSATTTDPAELVLTITLPPEQKRTQQLTDDLETFDGILMQYHDPPSTPAQPVVGVERGEKDLRGRLVMINEDNGEVVGEVEDRFRIREDQVLYEKGHENDPVIIDVPERSLAQGDADVVEAFARIVPPDERDWITKSATIVSQAISMTTNLLLATITMASSYYISHSTPTPSSSQTNLSNTSRATPSKSSRALTFLTSARTRRGLTGLHTVSVDAVKVSTKTVTLIDSMIRRALGADPKRTRTNFAQPSSSSALLPPLPSRSPSPSHLAPPSYNSAVGDNKPPLPTRRSASPASMDSRDRSPSQVPPPPPDRKGTPQPAIGISEYITHLPPTPRLTTKERVLISADLILSTIDISSRKLLDVGTDNFGKVMSHKYGPEAAQSSLLMAGTARNVGLVYIDMHGIGRRALLRRAGKTFVKARASEVLRKTK